MPEELKAALEQAAATNGRSLTAEIVARLTASMQPIENKLMLEGLGHALSEQLKQQGVDILDLLKQSLPDVRDYPASNDSHSSAKEVRDEKVRYLEMQLADVDEQVRLASFPLADALHQLQQARESGDVEDLHRRERAYAQARDRVTRLDRRALEIQAELRRLRSDS